MISIFTVVEIQRDGETEGQSVRKTERQRDRETERQRDRETERHRGRETSFKDYIFQLDIAILQTNEIIFKSVV